MGKVVIFGTQQLAELAAFYFAHDSDLDVVAFTLSGDAIEEDRFQGRPVVPFEDLEAHLPPDDHQLFIGIAYSDVNRNRERFFREGKAKGYGFPTYVCSKATTWPGLAVGEGSFIFEDNVIQPFTPIGANTVLWSGNHIGHHSRIGDHVFIASHVVVSGNCVVEDNCFLGVNATLRDGVTIGHHAVIGAGALILRDVEPHSVYKGRRTEPREYKSGDLRRI